METKRPLLHCQNRFSKWLFAAILLLSFFTFSGLELRAEQTSSDTQQTSFLGKAKFKSVKSIGYKRALNQVKHYQNHFFPINSLCHLAQLHTLLLNAKAGNYNPPLLNIQKISLFYRLKSVVQNDDDRAIA